MGAAERAKPDKDHWPRSPIRATQIDHAGDFALPALPAWIQAAKLRSRAHVAEGTPATPAILLCFNLQVHI